MFKTKDFIYIFVKTQSNTWGSIFVKIVKSWKPLSTSVKNSITDFRLGFKYAAAQPASYSRGVFLFTSLIYYGCLLFNSFMTETVII